MRLDFNVLWVDDQIGMVEGFQEAIFRKLRNEGFEFKAKNVTSIDESISDLSVEVFHDEIDLILVDYDLGAGGTGDVVLKRIREIQPFKEIIFYSAVAPKKLKQLAFDQDVAGIYCASRDALVDTVMGVFETLVKKVLDIDHMRGIVMGATAEIDNIVNDCLLEIHDNKDVSAQAVLLKQAKIRIDKKKDEHVLAIEKALGLNSFSELLENRSALSADQKLAFLVRVLAQFKELKEMRDEIIKYKEDIVPKRNTLAHARLIPNNSSKSFQGRDGQIIDSVEMKRIRCALLDHRATFCGLLKSLKNSDSCPYL